MESKEQRLAKARAALKNAEVTIGVRSHQSQSVLETSISPGVYHIPLGASGQSLGVEGVVYSLTQVMTADMWGAVVGIPDVGWEAASQMGLDLDRVVAVPVVSEDAPKVAGALIEGFDVIAIGEAPITLGTRRALAARARRMDRFVLTLSPWIGISRPIPLLRKIRETSSGFQVIEGGVAV